MVLFEEDIIKQIDIHFEDCFIVSIAYKYSFEKTYTNSIEVFCVHFDQIIWFNDWYEGQEDVLVGVVVPITQAYKEHFIVTDIQKIFEERR